MNILVIRLSAIGDIFFCTSILPVLKSRYPGCRITWLAEPVGSSIVDGHPLVDDVITLPRKAFDDALKAGRLWVFARKVYGLACRLREQSFDLVLDPQGLLKSGIWAHLARADYRVGVGAHDGSGFLYDCVIRYQKPPESPILMEYRELARLMGEAPGEVAMDLHVGMDAQKEADAFLSGHALTDPIIFCPFTTRPQKHWFDESWARLGELVEANGMGSVVILGGPGDGEHARRIAGQMSVSPVIAAGEKRSLHFALGLIRRSAGLVGVDTGLTHAGIAFARPTVCLFGSTRPYVQTGRLNARVLFHDLDCAPCRRHPTCNGRFDCMRLHTPESVKQALAGLMAP